MFSAYSEGAKQIRIIGRVCSAFMALDGVQVASVLYARRDRSVCEVPETPAADDAPVNSRDVEGFEITMQGSYLSIFLKYLRRVQLDFSIERLEYDTAVIRVGLPPAGLVALKDTLSLIVSAEQAPSSLSSLPAYGP